jgi:uncharacterized protein DUF5670
MGRTIRAFLLIPHRWTARRVRSRAFPVFLLLLWLFGYIAHVGGQSIHLVLVAAVLLFVVNLVTAKRIV